MLFKGQLLVGANQDVLRLSVPDSLLPGAIKMLVKVEGSAGATELPAS